MSDPGIISATRAVEARLVGALDLEPLALDPVLAFATGVWHGAPVEIRTTAYDSATIGYARFATVQGEGLAIDNTLCVARSAFPLPVLAADLVATRRDSMMIAADVSPVTPDDTEVAVIQARYLAMHRADDKGLRLLAAMFGSEWATRYLEMVLFPVVEPLV